MKTEAIPADPGDARYRDLLCRMRVAAHNRRRVHNHRALEFPRGRPQLLLAVQLAGGLAAQRRDVFASGSSFYFLGSTMVMVTAATRPIGFLLMWRLPDMEVLRLSF
jgi:hypothetical protein